MWRTVVRVTGVTVAFGVIHSFLASDWIKKQVERQIGDRSYHGLYRLVFNVLAVLSFAEVLRQFSRLSDRTLYVVRPPWSLPLRLVQIFAVYLALDANARTGIGRMTGIQPARQFMRGESPVLQNPAQGPQLTDRVMHRTAGAFQLSRHPNNLVPVLLWWANPKMTVRFLTFTLVSTIYLILGSVHEEWRLSAAYGERYERYKRGVPFFFPFGDSQRLWRRARLERD